MGPIYGNLHILMCSICVPYPMVSLISPQGLHIQVTTSCGLKRLTTQQLGRLGMSPQKFNKESNNF